MSNYTKYDELPLVLDARNVADILGISLSMAYRLFDRDDFPTIRTGMRRKLVSREAFFDWLKHQQR
ncbi:MAG: helix-turn-helix domain-containing protein [Pygmaiobacter massiliensis]|nr:helix-turn-helix domain-containing protein [Pygmaiobacter massiliensis]